MRPETLGKKFKLYLVENDLTQRGLTRPTGLSLPKINLFCNGWLIPKPEFINSICNYLELDPELFARGEFVKKKKDIVVKRRKSKRVNK